ncbi:MAG: BrnA antitoxin family protein [Aridibacter sp.]
MLKKLKEIPKFKSEDEEREFWSENNSTDFVDWDKAKATILPKLKPTTKTISLRISESMLNQIRLLANQCDVPYQSLIKIFLKDKIDEELKLS